MTGFLLIHGSWHGAWCWEDVAPILRAGGHDVVAPDLPSHGNDRTPAWRTTLEGYARAIHDAARGMKAPPVVVGHSIKTIIHNNNNNNGTNYNIFDDF